MIRYIYTTPNGVRFYSEGQLSASRYARPDEDTSAIADIVYWGGYGATTSLCIREFYDAPVVPAGELCPVVAARILRHYAGVGSPQREVDADYIERAATASDAIKEVGTMLAFDEDRGPFARAAKFFFGHEERYDALVEDRMHREFLAIVDAGGIV